MSNNDSFIDEVSEEMRRDRLYAFFRRWGWLIALVIVVVVGGAAINEWRKAQAQAAAEDAGDAILEALAVEDATARADAVALLDTGGTEGRRALQALFTASAAFESGSLAEALAQLEALAGDDNAPPLYRDLATLKWAIIGEGEIDADQRRDRLSALTLAGGPYRLLAQEQIALVQLETGEETAALDLLRDIIADQEVSQEQRRRIEALIVALGGTPAAG